MGIVNVTANPNDSNGTNTLSNGNLTITNTSSNSNIRATTGKLKGKWYWEVKFETGSTGTTVYIGVSKKSAVLTMSETSVDFRGYYFYNGYKYPENESYGSTSTINDVIGVALDLDNGKLEFYKNGTSLGISHTDLLSLGEVVPHFKFGTGNFTRILKCNFGSSSFTYQVPQGYQAYAFYPDNKFLISSEEGLYSVSNFPESDDIIPAMTSNVTTLGEVICSDENIGYPAWWAFDKKAITSDHQFSWISATFQSGWIGFNFFNPIIIDRYTITGRSDTAYTMSPKEWTFEGSNNGIEWVVLDKRMNVSDWNVVQTKSFQISNKIRFKMYRINAVSANSSNGVLIKEIKLGCPTQGKYVKKIKDSDIERVYLKHGMSESDSIDMSNNFSTRIFADTTAIPLGSGKVFKQKIDRSKHRANKIILG